MKTVHAGLMAVGILGALALPAQAEGLRVFCASGPGMSVIPQGNRTLIAFQASDAEAPAGPGECTLANGPLTSPLTLIVPPNMMHGAQVLEAAEGGDFQVEVTGGGDGLLVTRIVNFNVMGGMLGGGGGGNAGNDQDDMGEDDMAGGGGEVCAPGEATVAIADPKLKKLNIRAEPSMKAEILDAVPEGDTVNVIGFCSGGNAGFAAKAADDEWCEIDAPTAGCVKAEFLEFDPFAGNAGLKRK